MGPPGACFVLNSSLWMKEYEGAPGDQQILRTTEIRDAS